MINKTKFNNICKLKMHMLFKFFYCLIHTILIIPFYILAIKPIYIISSNKLAFNVNVIYFDRINDNYQRIRSIEFEGLNNIISKYVVYKHYSFFYFPSTRYNQLIRVINSFKISGLVNHIKYYMVKTNKIQFNIINISINPLIKKIVILKFRKLQIPQHLLNKYFKVLLGLPKNYKQLNHSMEKIYFWYKTRGFDYIHIDLIENHDTNFLFVKIQEGLIKKTSLDCESASALNINQHYLNYLERRIIQELSIVPGNILNTKKIEIGIKKLKESKLISHCKYRIVNYRSELKIIVSYDIYQDHINYINGKYVNLCNQNKFNILYSILHPNQNIRTIHRYYKNLRNFICLCFSTKLEDNIIIKPKISSTSIFDNIYIRELEKNLSFKYSKLYKKNNNWKHIIFNIKLQKNYPVFDVSISLPSVQITDNLFAYLLLYFYKNLNWTNITYPMTTIDRFKHCKLNEYNSSIQLKSKNIGVQFQHRLSDYTDLNEEINLVYNDINKNIIHIKQQCLNHIFSTKTLYQKYLLKTLKQTVQQTLLKLDISLKYNDFHLAHHIQQGTSFLLQLQSLIYLPFKKLHMPNSARCFDQYVNMKYHKIIMLPKFISYIKSYKNAIIISGELYSPVNSTSSLDTSLKNSIKFHHTYHQNCLYKTFYGFTDTLYLYDIEYHIFLRSNYSLYIFYNYRNDLNEQINRQTYNNLYSSLSNQLNNYETNIGSGIQFNVPIRQIPPLRLEYCISNGTKKFFQLHVYSRYQEYNL